jgi:hypothetical protein
VLAVPDALLMGRWTDGAVLAVRHDSSRLPLVEQANRRLARVGVPVLGAVVNGVRPPPATATTTATTATASPPTPTPAPPTRTASRPPRAERRPLRFRTECRVLSAEC